MAVFRGGQADSGIDRALDRPFRPARRRARQWRAVAGRARRVPGPGPLRSAGPAPVVAAADEGAAQAAGVRPGPREDASRGRGRAGPGEGAREGSALRRGRVRPEDRGHATALPGVREHARRGARPQAREAALSPLAATSASGSSSSTGSGRISPARRCWSGPVRSSRCSTTRPRATRTSSSRGRRARRHRPRVQGEHRLLRRDVPDDPGPDPEARRRTGGRPARRRATLGLHRGLVGIRGPPAEPGHDDRLARDRREASGGSSRGSRRTCSARDRSRGSAR